MKRHILFLVCFILIGVNSFAADAVKVLYDDTHGQTAGNADWVITGAYSEMVDVLKTNGFSVDSLKSVSPSGKISPELLGQYKGLILAEPNNPYQPAEQTALVDFIRNGGGAFLIADHGGADRDNDGYDAVKALNEFVPKLGFKYAGDFFYEAPVCGTFNKDHPVMYGMRAVGAWAASTIQPVECADSKMTELIGSRNKKAPYIAAIEAGKGRVVAIGDSSPFDDGTGSGGKKQLHDSYDSFMYSHPQLAFNAMKWVTGQAVDKRIPSRTVPMASEAKAEDKAKNLLIDAAHGNAASDKMETYDRHMNKMGIKVYYNMNLITPETLSRFTVLVLPDPSMRYMDPECVAICDWLMAGGRLIMSGDWDSADLSGRGAQNYLLEKIGSVMRMNDDQVWDQIHKTNKPWGVLTNALKEGSPITAGVKTLIAWGTCSLITRDNKPLTEAAGVEILASGDDDSFNKDGNKKNDAILYPKGIKPPICVMEKLANGIVVVIGCSNFTDYQYPDSDINQAKPGPAPFVHETPLFHDNIVKFLAGAQPVSATPTRSKPKTKKSH